MPKSLNCLVFSILRWFKKVFSRRIWGLKLYLAQHSNKLFQNCYHKLQANCTTKFQCKMCEKNKCSLVWTQSYQPIELKEQWCLRMNVSVKIGSKHSAAEPEFQILISKAPNLWKMHLRSNFPKHVKLSRLGSIR